MRGEGVLLWGIIVVAILGLALCVLGLQVEYERFGCSSTVEMRVMPDPQTGVLSVCRRRGMDAWGACQPIPDVAPTPTRAP